MKRLRALFDDGRHDDAWRRLYDLAQQTDDYGRFSSLLRWRRRLSANTPRPARLGAGWLCRCKIEMSGFPQVRNVV